MNENLIKREEMRQSMVETNKRDKELNKIDGEDSDYLLKQINEIKLSIESKLETIDKNEGKEQMEQTFDELNSEYEKLNKLINDSSLFLAKYSLKSAQTLLNALRITIDAKKDLLIPKSKFSFKTSFKPIPKPLKTKTENCDQTDSIVESTPFFGFKNVKNSENLQMLSEESNGKDIQLDGLENCRIEIFGAPNALKINNLLNCKVFCGPTTTSILIANCEKCMFRIASQQIRIHGSSQIEFYIYVSSRAIIEDSTKIGFAPYDWSYPNITEDFKSADLDINTNNWKQIDDFDCLSTDSPSNNWSFIDSKE